VQLQRVAIAREYSFDEIGQSKDLDRQLHPVGVSLDANKFDIIVAS
jgi:hypothetical protein